MFKLVFSFFKFSYKQHLVVW